MFKCQICKKDSKANERAAHVVTQYRPKIYLDEYGEEQGRGYEIVTEILAHQKCSDKYLGVEFTPEVSDQPNIFDKGFIY